ncbi:hypothetical protein AMEX_G1891 [Astyanax mexicanus]|uniref:Uncharacterized protein n=1 Tax=Astyanax mexicanus TaxID=7994 RepID=A0A8T2MFC4_ASTMX|nr:hypothetical protein AMEX_G1891 [Astyanax mexicanus]
METAKMFFRLPRMSPGYFRYLKTQAVQSVEVGGDVNMTPRLAILLGAVGLGLSSYSSRQLTIHHKPCQRTLR